MNVIDVNRQQQLTTTKIHEDDGLFPIEDSKVKGKKINEK